DVRLRCRAAPADLGRLDAGNFAVRGGVCERTGKRRAALSADPSALSCRSDRGWRPIGSFSKKSIPRNAIADDANSAAPFAPDKGLPFGIGDKVGATVTNRARSDSLAHEVGRRLRGMRSRAMMRRKLLLKREPRPSPNWSLVCPPMCAILAFSHRH